MSLHLHLQGGCLLGRPRRPPLVRDSIPPADCSRFEGHMACSLLPPDSLETP